MSRCARTYKISITFLIIASLIYQSPIVGATRLKPLVAKSSRDSKATELFGREAERGKAALAGPDLRAATATATSYTNMPFFAPSLTASLADDIGLGVKKNPGDTITYTATITNGGASPADDATGMIFSAILDSNTTLVPGSVNAQPIAKPDSYTGSGNIPISIAAPGVLTNDVDPMTGTNAGLTVTEVQGSAANLGIATNTTAAGIGLVTGSVTLNGNGSFTYEPPPGFTGNDTFTYKTSEGTLTDTNTVTITISNMVWFIKNTGGGLNRGTFSNPFTSIASFNSANAAADAVPNPKSGDFIALHSGTYAEADGVNLRNTQKLIGEAIQFNTVFTADSNSSSAYTTFAGGTNTAPAISTSAGNGIDLGSGNTVRGLNVGNTPGFFGFNGGAVGSPVINTVNKTGTGGAINVSTSGTFGAIVSFGTLESSSSPGANINLVSVTGTLGITSGGTGLTGSAASSNAINISGGSVGFTYAANVTKASLGSLLNVSNGHTGTLTFNTGTLSATAGTGLQFDNADGAYNFNGTTTLNGGDAGVDILNGSGGTFSFTSGATVTNPTGVAFNVSASAPSVTYPGNITANSNRAVSISNAAAAGCGTQTFSGSINGSGASASGILVNNCNAGTLNFSGTTLTLSTQANHALTLTGNAGATINLSGGNLSLTTTNGHGINATGGGAVNVTGNDNTINTTGSGSAVNWAMLTGVHSSGTLRFKTINKSGSGAKGILVNYHDGTFTVTGDDDNNGTPDSLTAGGTISGTSARGAEFIDIDGLVSLGGMTFNNTVTTDGSTCGGAMGSTEQNLNCNAALHLVETSGGVTLRMLNINGSSQGGINGNKVTNLVMSDIEVANAGDEIDEHGIAIKNLLGTGSAANLNLHDNESRQLYLVNANNNDLTSFAITNSTFANSPAPNGGQGLLIESQDAGTSMTVNISGSTFQNLFTNAYQVACSSGSTQDVDIIGSHFTNVNSWMVIQASGGNVTYSVQTNDGATGVLSGSGAINLKTDNGGVLSGDVTSNIIGNNNVGSGAVCGGGCSGLFINQRQGGSLTANIVGNTIRHVDSSGIYFSGGQDSTFGAGKMNVTITGNLIRDPDGVAPAQAIAGQSGVTSGPPADANCLAATIGGLTIPGAYPSTAADAKNQILGNWDPTPGSLGNEIFLFRGIGTAFFKIPGLVGGATAWVTARNDMPSVDGTDVFTSGVTAGTCPLLLAWGGIPYALNPDFQSLSFDYDQLMAANGSESARLNYLSAPTSTASVISELTLPATPVGVATSLSQEQLNLVVSAALQRWIASGLTAQQAVRLRGIRFEVADLQDGYLGEADSNRILVDRNAGGQGWYAGIDRFSDSLFNHAVASTRRYTYPMSAAAGHIDLLTAVEHEMGHRLGLVDTYSASDRNNLMYGYLTVGERRLPAAGQGRHARVDNDAHKHFLMLSSVAETRRLIPPASAIKSGSKRSRDIPLNHSVQSSPVKRPSASEDKALTPLSGETVTVNGSGAGFTLPGGDSVTITFQATVNTPPGARSVSTQGKVSGSNFTLVNGITTASPNTNDPETAAVNDATVTNINTLSTWTGATSTDWNTFTNWSPNTYAPGVSNPAVNDVVIPNVGQQPNISATDIGIYSLNISNGRTLTIDPARILTIGGSPGGDLTLDGIISGGFLNLGTGTHVINNAGGTGSLSATNLATVLSGSTVTLNDNLQAGALAVDAGGSMNITGKTLSLNGAGAALTVPGGATFTTTTSTVLFNGTAAQQAAGISYNNLTINNSLGAHVTGVTLTGNATVSGVLTLTTSDLATGANTLTMPNTATSAPATGATDVVGNVKRTGFVSGGLALSFGNPLNTIRINSGTAPTDINVLLAKNVPATYALAVQRSYTITPNGGSSINATVRLHYRQAELNGNDDTSVPNFNFRRFTAGAWKAVVPTSRNTNVVEDNWLENNAVTTFSEWTFANLSPSAASGTVRGTITDSNGTPVEGVVIRLSGEQTRKTITDSKGRYYFDNVDVNGFYTVTPSRVNYHFTPFNRAFTQLGNQTDAAFGAVWDSDSQNPLDTPEYFVRQQYVDILGREPDEGGFNYWSDRILACDDAECANARRSDIAAAFFIEQEFQQTGSYIYNLYKGSLGRRPGYSEYAADRRQVIGGPDLETEKTAFANSFVQRADFVQKYQSQTTGESFVDALLANVWQSSNLDLGTQRGVLLALYQTGSDTNQSRALVLRQVGENPSLKGVEYNPAFVLTEYFGYLRRNPEPEGYDFWLNVLNNREPGNFRGMVCSFITSTEYQKRFSAVVTHSNAACGR